MIRGVSLLFVSCYVAIFSIGFELILNSFSLHVLKIVELRFTKFKPSLKILSL